MGGLRIQGVYAHGQPWTAGMEGKKTEDCGRDKHAIVNQHAVRDIMFFNQSVNRDAPLPESYFQTDSNAAKSLRRQYPQVNFIFVETNVYSEEMEQFISQVRQGAYILMPFDVLDWMSQGEEAAGQGMEMIGQAVCRLARNLKAGAYSTGVVLGERGEDIYWTAFDTQEDTVKEEWEREAENVRGMLERMEESRKRNQERMKKLKLVQKKKINYQMGRDMARLAKGTTVKEIRFLISKVYASRRQLAASSQYDKTEIRNVTAQMDHVIRCARTKLRQLKEENQLEIRQKKAQKQREEKRRRELEQELKERRRKRMAREHAQIFQRLSDWPGLQERDDCHGAQKEELAIPEGFSGVGRPVITASAALKSNAGISAGQASSPEVQ